MRHAQGTYLDGLLQQCVPCDARTVSLTSGATTCAACPFTSARVNASLCVPCPENSKATPYELARCACDVGFYDALFGASLINPVCVPCPLGGDCSTGFLGASEGWWRETTLSDMLYKCREGRCIAEDVVGPLSANWSATSVSVAAPGGAPPANASQLNNDMPTNCVEGFTGPLCSICLPGYTLQSGVCALCDPKDAWEQWPSRSKSGLLIGVSIVVVVVISVAFFQPVVPALEHAVDATISGAKACFTRTKATVTCSKQAAEQATGKPKPPAEQQVSASEAATHAGVARQYDNDLYEARDAQGDNGNRHREHHTSEAACAAADAHAVEVAVAVTAGSLLAQGTRHLHHAVTGGALDDDGDGGTGGSTEAEEMHDSIKASVHFLHMLEEMMEKAQKMAKIIVNVRPVKAGSAGVATRSADRVAPRPTTDLLITLRAAVLSGGVNVFEVAGCTVAKCVAARAAARSL